MNIASLLFNWVKDKIKVSRTFWRYRHLLHSDVWSGYLGDSQSTRRLFYSNFVKCHGLNSVFEFGCGPGPNLLSLKENVGAQILVYGVDINAKAVALANRHVSEPRFVTTRLKEYSIKAFLTKHSLKKFDLAIYDRVLYLLTPKEVAEHFSQVSGFFNFIILDDFASDEPCSNGTYKSKNYENILKNFGFELIQDAPSEHYMKNEFFATASRRQVFRKRIS